MTAATPVVVLDAGALIAMERSAGRMTALMARLRSGQVRFVIPDAVLAQAWRGGTGRQARMAAVLGLGPEKCVAIPLDTAAARRIGMMIARSGHTDVVDVHVALVAADHRASVVTSDRDDLLKVDPTLHRSIIDV